MADDEILRRIDEHMDRGNELIVEVRDEVRLSRQAHSDLREFIREQTLRAERVADRQVNALDALVIRQDEGIAALREMRAEIRDTRAEMHEARAEMHEARGEMHEARGDLADLRDESRAQTQALLKMIDRLG